MSKNKRHTVTKIYKVDRYQDGEDTIARTYPNADIAVKELQKEYL